MNFEQFYQINIKKQQQQNVCHINVIEYGNLKLLYEALYFILFYLMVSKFLFLSQTRLVS